MAQNANNIGIYIVESPLGTRPRAIVIATSSQAACETVGRHVGMNKTEIGNLNVGRIGNYDPGIQGASFMCDGSMPPNFIADDGIASEYDPR